jgi:hypothetical protein
MAIIYSYQENEELLNSDMLVGTATTLHNGQVRKITKNFTLGQLKTFISTGDLTLSNGGTSGPATLIDNILNIPVYQGAITLTTTGSTGPATLVGNTLNIPQYGGTPPTPTLNQVLTAGNTSLNDAKIGALYLYDDVLMGYGGSQLSDNVFSTYTKDGNPIFGADPTGYYGFYKGLIEANLVFDSITAFRQYSFPDQSGTIALTSDIPVITTPTLDEVLLSGNIVYSYTSIIYPDDGLFSTSYDNGTSVFTNTGSGDSVIVGWSGIRYQTSTPSEFTEVGFITPSSNNAIQFPDASGTIALLSDIPSAITLTTTGSSGSSTLISGVLNVPTYTLAGLGGVPTSRTLTINGTAYDLTADRSWSVGTVTSVGLSMPPAFTVASSPITGSGTIAVTGAGTVSQYVRGDGTLANFPNSTGGGASVNYYLNGSVSQGTFGGTTYYQMSKTPILGAGTNFIRTNGAGNGYIASFITDAGDPSFLNIPGGNWNLEFYFQSSASGGSPQFYGEIYKVSATNVFTLVASGSANPEGITNGTTVDQYYTSIPVPQTSLLITDRLAIRIYVITAGRTITLHTENGNLCEVLTTFTTGLTALNGLTQQVQYFAVGTSGTDFNISSATDTHTFNLPTASATNRGALSSADWTAFNGKFTLPSLTSGSVIFSNGTTLAENNANFFWDNSNSRLGLGTTTPTAKLDVNGDALINEVTVGRGPGNDASNTVIGKDAFFNNLSGQESVIIGYGAGNDITTGTGNVIIGKDAGGNVAIGNGNTIIGTNNSLPPTGSPADFSDTLSISKGTSSFGTFVPHIWAPANVSTSSTSTVISAAVSLYRAMFVEYVIEDENGNIRGGYIKGIWNNDLSVIKMTEDTTSSIGVTSDYVFNIVDGGSSNAALQITSLSSDIVYCAVTSRLLTKVY